MTTKTIITKLLMTFVLVSIGFAIGKEVTFRKLAGQDHLTAQAAAEGQLEQVQDKVIVYYMHGTFRCVTCNSIETMAKEVIENDFADAMADGRLEWQVVNFQNNAALARRYGVGTSTLVIAKIADGKEVEFKRLDEVWTKINDPGTFKQYVDEMIQQFLDGDSV
jgi:hypothetical protein